MENQHEQNISELTKKIIKEIRESHNLFFMEGFVDGQRDAYKTDCYGLNYFQNAPNPTWPPYMIAEICGENYFETLAKYESLGGIGILFDKDYEFNLESFYGQVDGNLSEKGFCNGSGTPFSSWCQESLLSWSYYDGWYQGVKLVLGQVETKMREIIHEPYKQALINNKYPDY